MAQKKFVIHTQDGYVSTRQGRYRGTMVNLSGATIFPSEEKARERMAALYLQPWHKAQVKPVIMENGRWVHPSCDTGPKEGCIGQIRNNWRQRMVYVYPHPTDHTKVISEGFPFDGSDPIICEEERVAYTNEIENWPRPTIRN